MRNILIIIFVGMSMTLHAQKKITVADIYQKRTFSEASVRGINWMNAGQYYSALEGNDIVKYDITTGEIVETILDGDALNPKIDFSSYSFNADESKVLLLTERESIYRRSYTAEFYIYDFASKSLTKLSDNGKQSYATLSPDGTKVAFVRSNNLFYVNLADGAEVQVTDDGKFNHIINGSTDWVYEEELSSTRAFEWSGNNSLFYLTFDESGVREYNMQVWNKGQLYPTDYRFKYPKAGEDNSKVKATIYTLSTKAKKEVKVGEGQYYIARISQTPNPDELSLIRLNRLQNKLDLLHVNTKTAQVKTILSETTDTYIDIDFVDDLTYLEDGKSFIFASEKSGFKHLYWYGIDGKLKNQITSGNWEVDNFLGVDESSKTAKLYFTSTEYSPMDRLFYSIDINGKNKKSLRDEPGVHSINMSSDFKYYIDSHSSNDHPLHVNLYSTAKNKLVKTLEDNQKLEATIKEYDVQAKEFFTFNTVDGTALNGYMIKPSNFDENKEYPALVFQYSGPGSQQVFNNWGGGSNFYWHQMLTQEGYIVVVIDPRGTGGRGAKFKKLTYKQLGKYESIDHQAGAKYLGNMPYIDEDRIGIWGWSYGGYMSSLAMFQGEGLFKAAIAVAPVTNWRFYDTIYTERYMDTPQNNADGYDSNSPTTHAAKLKGNYLLVHGTGDDNVHFQNAVTLQNVLIGEGKQFDSFYYPDRAHGISKDNARMHLFTMLTNWVKENL